MGGGAGRREEKMPASKAYEINERPLISRARLLFRNANTANENRFNFFSSSLKLLPTITLARVWNGTGREI